MCGIKLQDRVPSKRLRERLGLDDIIVGACAAKRRQWLGEEIYGVWSSGFEAKR